MDKEIVLPMTKINGKITLPTWLLAVFLLGAPAAPEGIRWYRQTSEPVPVVSSHNHPSLEKQLEALNKDLDDASDKLDNLQKNVAVLLDREGLLRVD